MRIAQTITSGAIPVQENLKPRRNLWKSVFKRNQVPNQFELQPTGTDFSL